MGMVTLFEDAWQKVADGITTVSEVMGKVPYYVPAPAAEASEKDIEEKTDVPVRARATLVLVSGKQEDAAVFHSVLEPYGYRIVATDYPGAFETVCREFPEVIVMDVDGNRTGRLDLTRKLQGSLSTVTIPVLLLQSGSELNAELDGLREGAAGVLSRPINSAQLVARLDDTLKQTV